MTSPAPALVANATIDVVAPIDGEPAGDSGGHACTAGDDAASPTASPTQAVAVQDMQPGVPDEGVCGGGQEAHAFFRERYEEMERRAAVTQTEGGAVDFEPAPATLGDDPPFQDPEHQWVVFSLSHVRMPPLATDASKPAVRIYGCFPDSESATEYACTIVAPSAPGCSIMLDRAHKWVLACREAARLADADLVERKTHALLEAHDARVKVELETFRERKARLQEEAARAAQRVEEMAPPSAQGGSDDEDEEEAALAAAMAPSSADVTPAREDEKRRAAGSVLPRTCELSGQAFIVASFVQDKIDVDEPEFLFRVYGAFASEVEADRYVRNVASKHVLQHDLDVVVAQKWLYPMQPPDVRTVYRSTELTKIMDYHRSEPAKVDAFKREVAMHQAQNVS